MLILVPTPIGHLGDISSRALETLASADLILCEDTRTSRPLLDRYQIKTPLKSYHAHNEAAMESFVLSVMRKGKTLALITDAGTPGISDPGQRLVAALHREHLPVSALPGPCAVITALSLSGFPSDSFQFVGFAPRKQQEREEWMRTLLPYPGTTILYETSQRLLSLLSFFDDWIPGRILGIARELTKKHEEFRSGRSEELGSHYKSYPPKGECVILIQGDASYSAQEWEALTPLEHVEWLEKMFRASRTEAMRIAASMRGVPKREVYNQMMRET